MINEQDIDLEAVAAQLASELAARREQRMSGMFAAVREMRRRAGSSTSDEKSGGDDGDN